LPLEITETTLGLPSEDFLISEGCVDHIDGVEGDPTMSVLNMEDCGDICPNN
jgi:hypothetical protein